MFTSGSTGQPKGVAITHEDIVSLSRDSRWASAHHRVLFHSPQAFDASTFEIWVPLLTGGQVEVAQEELSPASVREMGSRRGVSYLFLTTALFNVLAEEDPGCFADLAEVWTGGEIASPTAFDRVLAHCPDLRLVHVYGPTETTTFALSQPVTRAISGTGTVPVGLPL
ncbi:AMP-binding protein, partial [Actinoalloteichus caeruleus]